MMICSVGSALWRTSKRGHGKLNAHREREHYYHYLNEPQPYLFDLMLLCVLCAYYDEYGWFLFCYIRFVVEKKIEDKTRNL
jgi:hypothetical protein